MPEPWRYRCPEGHASISTRQNGTYRCQSCETTYRGDPVDAASDRDSQPTTEVESTADIGALEVTHMLWRETGDTSTTAHARDLPVKTRTAAHALQSAAERGYVDRIERSCASRWFVTELGERFMPGATGAEVET
jgi:hypothetical protein